MKLLFTHLPHETLNYIGWYAIANCVVASMKNKISIWRTLTWSGPRAFAHYLWSIAIQSAERPRNIHI